VNERGRRWVAVALGLLFSLAFVEFPLLSLNALKFTTTEVIIAFFLIVAVLTLDLRRLRIDRITIGLAVVMVSMIVTTLAIADGRLAAAKFIVRFGVGVALFIFLRQLFSERRMVLTASRALAAGSVVYSGIGIWQHFAPKAANTLLKFIVPDKFAVFDPSSTLSFTTGIFFNGERFIVRASSIFGYCNTFSYYLVVTIGAAILLLLVDKDRYWRQLAALSIGLGLYALWLTYSRGAWLALAGGLTVGVLCWARLTVVRGWKRWGALAGVIALVVVSLCATFMVRRGTPTAETNDEAVSETGESWLGEQTAAMGGDTVQTRRLLWSAALSLWRTAPVFGIGVDRFRFHFYGHLPEPNFDLLVGQGLYQPHNIFLTALAGQGLLGLAALLFLAVVILHTLLRRWRAQPGAEYAVAVGLLTVVALANLYDAMMFDSYVHMLLVGYVLALITAQGKHDE